MLWVVPKSPTLLATIFITWLAEKPEEQLEEE